MNLQKSSDMPSTETSLHVSFPVIKQPPTDATSHYLASMTACLITRAVKAMDVSMSSALLLRFVSRCRSGSAAVKSPMLSHNCDSHPPPTQRGCDRQCSHIGHHANIAFHNLALSCAC